MTTEPKSEAEAAAPLGTTPAPSPTTSISKQEASTLRRIYNVLSYTPPRCRWDPEQPPKFSYGLNILFAFAAGFTVANLYYNHPILNILAHDFDVDYAQVGRL
jgi:hypothetical protein